MKTQKPNIYDYVDYRRFLRDFYAWNKKSDPSFSLRYFSAQAGIKSFNYLKLIIDGERRLTETFFAPFSRAMKLDEHEAAYFAQMVAFNHEDSPQQQSRLLDALLALRPVGAVQVLHGEQCSVFDEWYYVPLIELTQTAGFVYDLKWIAERLGVNLPTARKAVRKLLFAGVLEEKGGTLVKTNRLGSSSDEIPSLTIRRYHSRNLELASRAIFEQPVEEREYGSVTFMVDAQKFARIKAKLKQFRQEIYEIVDDPSPEGTEVYQLGFQLFRMIGPARKEVKGRDSA